MEPFNPDDLLDISKEHYEAAQKFLRSGVEQDGRNFSSAQVKLIQIGRAMLMRPKILLIDSSFFNVEEIYERLYYSLIFKNLSESTIVSILDRFDMVNHFDKVIVLEHGTVVEVGNSNDLLLKSEEGPFAQLVRERRTVDEMYLKKMLRGTNPYAKF